jgi:hypothetical protein
LWVCGFVGLWGLWVCGFVGLWVCGFVGLVVGGLVVCGCVDPRFRGDKLDTGR